MNTRIRLLVILFGALIVAATYSFPLWFPRIYSTEELSAFPELPEDLQIAFAVLPASERTAYLALRSTDPNTALRMATARLQANVTVPPEQQTMPLNEGQVPVALGDFVALSPIRRAEGSATIYQLPDGSRFLWLDGFSTVQGPGLLVLLSTLTREAITDMEADMAEDETMEFVLPTDDIILGPLTANVGSQRFDVPTEAELPRYTSIVLYSRDLNLVYSIAELAQ